MKLINVGMSAALLLPVGIILMVAGFVVDSAMLRTPLQLLGLAALGCGALQGQRLVNSWQKMLEES